LTVGTYFYVAVCTLQARSARRREALRRPQREEGWGHIVAAACPQLVVFVLLKFFDMAVRLQVI